jgi:membrane-associated phospholipid phosphatase
MPAAATGKLMGMADPTLQPAARFGARATLAALALALLAVPFGLLLLLVQASWRPLLRADEGASEALHRYALAHDGFVTAMSTISTIGSARVYVPVMTALAVWLLWRRAPRTAVFLAVTVAGSALVNTLVKHLVDRARPLLPEPVAHAAGLSFPSGHAQSAMVTYGVLLLVFGPRLHGAWRVVAVALSAAMVLAIGFSRVALGVHFASDVVAGYVLGAAWVAALTAAFSAWRREHRLPSADPAGGGLEPEAGHGGVPSVSRG